MKRIKNKCLNCGKKFLAASEQPLCTRCKELKKEVSKKETNEKVLHLKLPYRFIKFTISAENISKFVFLDNKRRLSAGNLASLKAAMVSGTHFDAPIVVYHDDGLYYVIDGNHRIENFIRILTKMPKFTMEVLLVIYDKLTKDEQILVFRRWNVGRPQSTDDFIQSVAKTIPMIKWIEEEFPIPVGVYKQPKVVSVRMLLNSYVAAKIKEEFGRGFNRKNFVGIMRGLTKEDYTFLKDFAQKYANVFNMPESKSPYYRNIFIQSVMYLSYENENSKQFFDSLAERVRGDAEVVQLSKMTGREASRMFLNKLREKLHKKQVLKVPVIRGPERGGGY